ncbi:hypothetical protein [Hymenobacter ruber]
MAGVWTKQGCSTAAPSSQVSAGPAVMPPADRPVQARPRLSVRGFVLTLITAAALTSSTTPPLLKIPADKAPRYIGKRAQVTGKVVRAYTAHHREGAPTFLNLSKPFPDCPLEVVLFANVAAHLKMDPAKLVGRTITVTGYIQAANGSTAQMVPDKAAALTVAP